MTKSKLCELACFAANNAYSPYSGFKVGAALLCKDGSVYLGCNVENAAFSATVCAERTAFLKAVSDGKSEFEMIAIAGGKESIGVNVCPPCGVCRQTMAEFCQSDDFSVLLVKKEGFDEYKLCEILPLSFSDESLK